MKLPVFFRSIRAKLLLIALLLLLIPIIGFRFVREMDGYLRDGQQQVLASAAKLLSASLSDRPRLFQIVDADSAGDSLERQRLLAMFSSADPETAANLGAAYVPSEDIERILNVVASNASRIWVVDAQSRVRGLAGALNSASRTSPAPASQQSIIGSAYSRMIRPVVRMLSPDPSIPTLEDARLAQRVVMSQVERALVGEANWRWRSAADGSGEILSVGQPVWQGDNIVGAVVLEETASSRQSIKFAALESLLGTTIVVFLVGFVALLGFAWRLASRMRRLQKVADSATDSHGRILGRIAGSVEADSDDEIGALAQTLDSALQRLGRYNGYLEQMAARLSHELRTPVAVVRSSLDNLRQGKLGPEARVYVDRADEGVRRLSGLISRMSEATQLEGLLQGAEKSTYDLAGVVESCVEGYRCAYTAQATHEFVFSVNTGEPVLVCGLPDALAQLLDKLVQNAVDFAAPGTAIRVSIVSSAGRASLSVENKGPLLPADAARNLFVSMVSSRGPSANSGDHLGLGLYIVRLISEFHGGKASARNLGDGSGVRFEILLPLAGSSELTRQA